MANVAMVLLPVVVGAVIGMVPAVLLEQRRHRANLRTRWDVTLERVCADFAAVVRRIVDLAQPSGDGVLPVAGSLREEHGHLQRLMAEIRLMAGPQVQLTARRVVRHAWALQCMTVAGVDPRGDAWAEVNPRERTLSSLFDFYLAVRLQLQVPHAEDLIPLNPPVDEERLAAADRLAHREANP